MTEKFEEGGDYVDETGTLYRVLRLGTTAMTLGLDINILEAQSKLAPAYRLCVYISGAPRVDGEEVLCEPTPFGSRMHGMGTVRQHVREHSDQYRPGATYDVYLINNETGDVEWKDETRAVG